MTCYGGTEKENINMYNAVVNNSYFSPSTTKKKFKIRLCMYACMIYVYDNIVTTKYIIAIIIKRRLRVERKCNHFNL